MELKSKYINEQYLFEAQMAQIQQQHNIFMNGGGGGPLSTPTTPPVVITDPDVLAFVAASGVTDNTQKSAVNTLVTSLKGYSIWTKLNAIYPFVGGTASTHKWNLKDPRDLDAAYRLSFSGGWTHNGNGITGNGTDAYGETYYNAQPINTLGVYTRTSGTAGGVLFGQSSIYDGDEASSNEISFKMFRQQMINFFDAMNTANAPYTKGTTITYTGNPSSTTAVKVYYDGVDLNRTHVAGFWAIQGYSPSLLQPILLGASKLTYYSYPDSIPTLGNIGSHTDQNIAFAFIGNTALTATEALNLNTAIVAYQTTLGRQV
jgi:hypothetical protein